MSVYSMRRAEKSMTEDKAREFLARAEFGFLATQDSKTGVYLIPLSFILKDNSIYFHCATVGQKLNNINLNPQVCFSVAGDTELLSEQYSTKYKSVVIYGNAFIVDDIEEKTNALIVLAKKYTKESINSITDYINKAFDKTVIVRIDIINISGKQKV